ncbi:MULTISPECIES: response regulator [Thiorhodovibrio]|uniref:response regulator n=1 Tax=Thiorhodovibrio TaxID=61593 RepID=UPI001F5CA629|nr:MULTISPECIES: response regulator [Thiorhodovibrio]WPL12083.1 Stalked cell differentiation-controlling protein [Thiorhodovibrio litoralis]
MPVKPGYKVLIVDDHQHNLYTLRTLIQKHLDAEVLEATSGREAIDITLDQRDIDLIILDVQMPEMDGFQTASLLKLRKRTRDIPIIFLTAAFKSEEFQQRGFAVGAVDYLLKPIDDLLLINKISTYFRLIEKERGLNRVLEQKVAERTAALEREKQYNERIITHMGEALLVLNPEGEIKFANPAACAMLNYSAEDLNGMAIGDVFEEDGDEEAGAFMGTWLEALIRTGALSKIDARFIAKDGLRVPILFSRTALLDPNNRISDIICIAKNMTGYIRLPEEDAPQEHEQGLDNAERADEFALAAAPVAP